MFFIASEREQLPGQQQHDRHRDQHTDGGRKDIDQLDDAGRGNHLVPIDTDDRPNQGEQAKHTEWNTGSHQKIK